MFPRESRPTGPADYGDVGGVYVVVGCAAVCGASGCTSRYWSANFAIFWKAGAATVPPQIAVVGSSTATRITSRGREAGTNPTNDATYFPVVYPCGPGFCAVPVLPATW